MQRRNTLLRRWAHHMRAVTQQLGRRSVSSGVMMLVIRQATLQVRRWYRLSMLMNLRDNFCSAERKFLGTFVPRSDNTGERTAPVTTSYI